MCGALVDDDDDSILRGIYYFADIYAIARAKPMATTESSRSFPEPIYISAFLAADFDRT